jgi:murein DD-endopeptidase MepM/ murein hydrolase activator NlpD
VPTGAEALIPRLPTPAAVRLEAAMEGANRLQTLCRLVERIPAGQPVAASGTSSGFGRRIDPFTRQPAMHTGIDLNAPLGTPVTATAPGRIVDVSRHAEYGLMVDVDHGFGIVSRYAHLSSAFVRRGDTIDAGNPVGLVGRTGRTTGDHLHYEVLLGGRPVDPTDFIKARRHVCETR